MLQQLAAGFSVSGGSNITIRRLHVDAARLPYTLGVLDALTATTATFTFDEKVYPFGADAPQPAMPWLLKALAVMEYVRNPLLFVDIDNLRTAFFSRYNCCVSARTALRQSTIVCTASLRSVSLEVFFLLRRAFVYIHNVRTVLVIDFVLARAQITCYNDANPSAGALQAEVQRLTCRTLTYINPTIGTTQSAGVPQRVEPTFT